MAFFWNEAVSLTGLIEDRTGAIENPAEQGIITGEAAGTLEKAIDWICKAEPGEIFTFSEGFYAGSGEAIDAKMATGNMAASGLAAGFYGLKKMFCLPLQWILQPILLHCWRREINSLNLF
jgi:hypothetical protein